MLERGNVHDCQSESLSLQALLSGLQRNRNVPLQIIHPQLTILRVTEEETNLDASVCLNEVAVLLLQAVQLVGQLAVEAAHCVVAGAHLHQRRLRFRLCLAAVTVQLHSTTHHHPQSDLLKLTRGQNLFQTMSRSALISQLLSYSKVRAPVECIMQLQKARLTGEVLTDLALQVVFFMLKIPEVVLQLCQGPAQLPLVVVRLAQAQQQAVVGRLLVAPSQASHCQLLLLLCVAPVEVRQLGVQRGGLLLLANLQATVPPVIARLVRLRHTSDYLAQRSRSIKTRLVARAFLQQTEIIGTAQSKGV